MNDHIDPDKLRKWMDNFIQEERTGTPHEWLADAFTELQNNFLTPRPRTLADMTEYERAKCQWAQAEHRDERCIIVRVDGHVSQLTVSLLTATGSTIWASADEVIPHPDKPRLVWPASEQEPGEESPEEPERTYAPGGVVQAALDKLNTPEPQVGEAWLVSTREGGQREALKAGNRWYVKDGDDVQDWVEEALIPIARLVPEVAPEVLVAKEDYENAPYGTICAEDGHFPLYTSTWTWYTIGGDSHNHSDLVGTPRRVLRWGMGEQGESHQEPATPEVAPKVLTTEEDYKNASLDTVVKDTTYQRSDVWDKWYENDWRTTTRHGSCKRLTDAELADTARQVVWEPEARA